MKVEGKSISKNKDKLIKAYYAWGAVALFFFYQYILRLSPGIMIDELRRDFNLTAEQFSNFGSFYLYAYSLLQIPLGILVDKIGVRKTIILSILLCIGGACLMAASPFLGLALLSRVLMGAGSATAFMCALKVIADRLPPGSRGFLMGSTLALGTIGALTAGKPLVLLIENYGWRFSLFFSAGLGVGVLLLAYFFLPVREKNFDAQTEVRSYGELFKSLLAILKDGRIMLYAFLAIGVYTPLSALADLWGTKFMMEKFFLSRGDAAHVTMMMYVGLALGSLFLPWVCEKYNQLDRAIQVCSFALLAFFSLLLFGPVLGKWALLGMTVTIGFFCGAEMMCFTGALLYTKPHNSGITIGVVNTLNMLGGALLQQYIGFALDWQWDGKLDNFGIRVYSIDQFVKSLFLLLVVIAVCALASLKLKKKKFNNMPCQEERK